jgi:hypothetical protein
MNRRSAPYSVEHVFDELRQLAEYLAMLVAPVLTTQLDLALLLLGIALAVLVIHVLATTGRRALPADAGFVAPSGAAALNLPPAGPPVRRIVRHAARPRAPTPRSA